MRGTCIRWVPQRYLVLLLCSTVLLSIGCDPVVHFQGFVLHDLTMHKGSYKETKYLPEGVTNPISGAEIEIRYLRHLPPYYSPSRIRTDANGRFDCSCVGFSRICRISVSKDGFDTLEKVVPLEFDMSFIVRLAKSDDTSSKEHLSDK